MSDLLYPPVHAGIDLETLPPVMRVGGKGVGLYWLAAQGFPTPQTWSLETSFFDQALRETGRVPALEKLQQALQKLQGAAWAEMQQGMMTIEDTRQKIVDALGTMEIFNAVAAALVDLPLEHEFWAVRSSATAEDHPQHSFAGQFLTLLSVPRTRLWDSVRQVWASTFNKSALMYCLQKRVLLPQMGVLLQPIAPVTARDRSGVAFSHSPVPTIPGVLIQVAFGLGETVVQGYGGDLYGIEGEQVRVQAMPVEQITISNENGGTRRVSAPREACFTEQEARYLAVLIKDIAARWKSVVDVEFIWRANDNAPQFVQVRSTMSQSSANNPA